MDALRREEIGRALIELPKRAKAEPENEYLGEALDYALELFDEVSGLTVDNAKLQEHVSALEAEVEKLRRALEKPQS